MIPIYGAVSALVPEANAHFVGLCTKPFERKQNKKNEREHFQSGPKAGYKVVGNNMAVSSYSSITNNIIWNGNTHEYRISLWTCLKISSKSVLTCISIC
jgi:hypothetical protein